MPIILSKSNFANRAQLDALLPPAVRQECCRYDVGSIELMKQLVLRNAGVAFMTQVGIEPELRGGRCVISRSTITGSGSSAIWACMPMPWRRWRSPPTPWRAT
ncbi:type 2 periplasmic-binding domain-containing protein [Gluconacetobacter sacchari]|uniref:LysR substrate-binding domain-containing protein n=2 Tax=Gluconacetobacter sacchari TaxID=92759 RepID=A0A7W4IE93_9PROT|nr:hypothetical protein [Gluconacetobacter sacchari]MBB2161255.1 hypothetical protein [Gluconacetobacter sacchari]